MRARLVALLLCVFSIPAQALPLFARQTGQNCVACHAGGQFPELTPYGRLFKLTGYTIGARTIPLSAMAVATNSRVANTSKSDDPASDFNGASTNYDGFGRNARDNNSLFLYLWAAY